MNKLINILLLILLLGCDNLKNGVGFENNGSQDTIFTFRNRFIELDSLKKQEYMKISEYNLKNKLDTNELIGIKDDTLKFIIDSTNNVTFINGGEGDEIRKYKHIGSLVGYNVVEATYWESREYFLVNKKNGEKYSMQSFPYISPNNKHFFTFSRSGDYDLMRTLLQVWKIENEKLIETINMDLYENKFGIDEVRWITDNELAVRVTFDGKKHAYCKMKIK